MAHDLVAAPKSHPLGHPEGYTPGAVAARKTAKRRARGPWDGGQAPSKRSVLRDLAAFLRLIRAWAQGRYERFPARSALLIALALGYVVSPIDAIPDFIPFVGVIDDGVVLALVLRALRRDVGPFVEWEAARA